MFADATLAARIDRAESRLTSGAAEAIRDAGIQKRVLIVPIAGGKAVYAGPVAPMNKLIGVGFEGPLDLSVLNEVEREWRDRAEPVRVELSILAHPTIGEVLTGARVPAAWLRECARSIVEGFGASKVKP